MTAGVAPAGRRQPLRAGRKRRPSPAARRLLAVVAATSPFWLSCGARAGVGGFADTCMAEIGDLSRLPARLAAAGFTEVDPASVGVGPTLARNEGHERLWQSRRRVGGDLVFALVGYSAPSAGRPYEACWRGDRPDGMAAVTGPELKKRFPPLDGVSWAGNESFYGGYERWAVQADPPVFVGLAWAARGHPESGGALFYAVKWTGPGTLDGGASLHR